MAFLFKRNNGYYYAIYKEGQRTVWQSLDTKEETQAQLRFKELRPSLERRNPSTLKELAAAILKYAEMNNSKGTVEVYRIALQHLVNCLGNRPLQFIYAMDGEKFKEYLLHHE